jgi:hypothetical protein
MADTENRHTIIRNRVLHLVFLWRIWNQLFARNEQYKYTIMRRAGSLFGTLRVLLIEDIVLRLCKLADPSTTRTPQGPRENLVLESMITVMADEQRKTKARQLLDQLKAEINPLRALRNRCIAHEDHNTALKLEMVETIDKSTIDRSLRLVIDIAHQLDDPEQPFLYDWLIAHGDGCDLLLALSEAHIHHNLRWALNLLRNLPERIDNLRERRPDVAEDVNALLPDLCKEVLEKAWEDLDQLEANQAHLKEDVASRLKLGDMSQ